MRFKSQGLQLLFYRAALPLSRQTLAYVAGIIRRHRAAIVWVPTTLSLPVTWCLLLVDW